MTRRGGGDGGDDEEKLDAWRRGSPTSCEMASASSKGTLAEELRALRQLIRAHRLQHHRAPYFRRVVECHRLGVEAATAPADDAADAIERALHAIAPAWLELRRLLTAKLGRPTDHLATTGPVAREGMIAEIMDLKKDLSTVAVAEPVKKEPEPPPPPAKDRRVSFVESAHVPHEEHDAQGGSDEEKPTEELPEGVTQDQVERVKAFIALKAGAELEPPPPKEEEKPEAKDAEPLVVEKHQLRVCSFNALKLRLSNPTNAETVTVLAVGGYGRGRLAPGSDIDLLFLLPYKRNATSESFVEHYLYFLWDLGLKVGHATRTVKDCMTQALADFTVRTLKWQVSFQ